jgi:hypothetical protein
VLLSTASVSRNCHDEFVYVRLIGADSRIFDRIDSYVMGYYGGNDGMFQLICARLHEYDISAHSLFQEVFGA